MIEIMIEKKVDKEEIMIDLKTMKEDNKVNKENKIEIKIHHPSMLET